jgi:Radical SAM superfamily
VKIGIISAYIDFQRKGNDNRGVLQPQIGPLIAGLLPKNADIEVVNDVWGEPDWQKHYDLLFISSLHSDFDRARQISHYWRRRGAKTVYGGTFASVYPHLCSTFFDSIAIGDPEGSVPRIYHDFCRGELGPFYRSTIYDPAAVPIPRFDLQADQQLLPISLEATRGCPFSCDFCALTSIGTRHHVRSPELVVRDIRNAQDLLRPETPWTKWYQLDTVVFSDNNIGGNPKYLRRLADNLKDLQIRWGASATFNIISNRELIEALSRSGCILLFVGLESFNPEALADMQKRQNFVDKIEAALSLCHKNGILIASGLMLSPIIDDQSYLRLIPEHLNKCGLFIPNFICFECPLPGTPHFHRLAAQEPPAFLPNALLRDFNGYTLVTRPQRESLTDFIEIYKWLLSSVYSRTRALRKFAHDSSRFLNGGFWDSAVVDLIGLRHAWDRADPDRTYIAGTDLPPPETVPLVDDDFKSQEQRDAIMEPWRVTDALGRVLPQWLGTRAVFAPNGRSAV